MTIRFPTHASTSDKPKSNGKQRPPKYAMLSVAFAIGAIVLFLLASLIDSVQDYSMYILIIGAALLVASWGIYFFVGKPSSKKTLPDERENVITVIGCKGCDKREERAFETGDFMFKELGPCAKCSGVSFIKAIYLIPTKKE